MPLGGFWVIKVLKISLIKKKNGTFTNWKSKTGHEQINFVKKI